MKNRNFTPFPILTTERLTLRQLTIDDKKDIFAIRTDVEINKYLNRQPSNSVEDAINFINKINDNIKENNALYWAITLTQEKTFVGTICAFDFSNETKSCEIGYELMTKFQKQGIMKEATQAIITYIFQILKIETIFAYTHKDNQNSTKLLSHFNFVKSNETLTESPDLRIYSLSQ